MARLLRKVRYQISSDTSWAVVSPLTALRSPASCYSEAFWLCSVTVTPAALLRVSDAPSSPLSRGSLESDLETRDNGLYDTVWVRAHRADHIFIVAYCRRYHT